MNEKDGIIAMSLTSAVNPCLHEGFYVVWLGFVINKLLGPTIVSPPGGFFGRSYHCVGVKVGARRILRNRKAVTAGIFSLMMAGAAKLPVVPSWRHTGDYFCECFAIDIGIWCQAKRLRVDALLPIYCAFCACISTFRCLELFADLRCLGVILSAAKQHSCQGANKDPSFCVKKEKIYHSMVPWSVRKIGCSKEKLSLFFLRVLRDEKQKLLPTETTIFLETPLPEQGVCRRGKGLIPFLRRISRRAFGAKLCEI